MKKVWIGARTVSSEVKLIKCQVPCTHDSTGSRHMAVSVHGTRFRYPLMCVWPSKPCSCTCSCSGPCLTCIDTCLWHSMACQHWRFWVWYWWQLWSIRLTMWCCRIANVDKTVIWPSFRVQITYTAMSVTPIVNPQAVIAPNAIDVLTHSITTASGSTTASAAKTTFISFSPFWA